MSRRKGASMSAQLRLMERDKAIAESLSLCVRLFSQRQIADHWFDTDLSNTRRRLKRLRECRLIDRVVVQARSMPEFHSPVVCWQPSGKLPDFGSAAWTLRSRWKQRAVRQTTAWIATTRAAQLFGGTARGEIKHGLQVTHDLGVAAIWLHFDRQQPTLADVWCGEDIMAVTRHGQKLPDAFLLDEHDQPFRAIEFGGNYDAQRVREFHNDCANRQLAYEIW
jgi:hypothetical protein